MGEGGDDSVEVQHSAVQRYERLVSPHHETVSGRPRAFTCVTYH
jgi:hypothetical protein